MWSRFCVSAFLYSVLGDVVTAVCFCISVLGHVVTAVCFCISVFLCVLSVPGWTCGHSSEFLWQEMGMTKEKQL